MNAMETASEVRTIHNGVQLETVPCLRSLIIDSKLTIAGRQVICLTRSRNAFKAREPIYSAKTLSGYRRLRIIDAAIGSQHANKRSPLSYEKLSFTQLAQKLSTTKPRKSEGHFYFRAPRLFIKWLLAMFFNGEGLCSLLRPLPLSSSKTVTETNEFIHYLVI